ncbi:hypothetical protein GIV76_18525 [Pseudomonas syringae]|nr:hypothetical protein [Pseudomonas syringae]
MINQLQQEREGGSACVPNAMEQMNAQSARSGKALDRGHVNGQNVSSIEQMRTRAIERGHFKDQALKPDHDRPSVSKTLEQIRSDAETRRLAKEQNSNETDIER